MGLFSPQAGAVPGSREAGPQETSPSSLSNTLLPSDLRQAQYLSCGLL